MSRAIPIWVILIVALLIAPDALGEFLTAVANGLQAAFGSFSM